MIVMNFADFVLLGQDTGSGGLSFLFPLALVGIFYYLIVFRPDSKMRAEHADLLKKLKKNDHIVTSGGIHGIVVQSQEGSSEVVIRIDENTNTKIHIQRGSISRVVTAEDEDEKA